MAKKRLDKEALEGMGFATLPDEEFLAAAISDPATRDNHILALKVYHDSVVSFYTATGMLYTIPHEDICRIEEESGINLNVQLDEAKPIDYGLAVSFGSNVEVSSSWVLQNGKPLDPNNP